MFSKKTAVAHPLSEELERCIKFIAEKSPDSPEYAAALDQIDKLTKIQSTKDSDKISKDTLVTVGANLAGILVIISHERVHVIASKALGFVSKLR